MIAKFGKTACGLVGAVVWRHGLAAVDESACLLQADTQASKIQIRVLFASETESNDFLVMELA